MKPLSLRLRSFTAALLVLVIFIPLSIIALQNAFSESLRQSVLEQMQVHNLTLISEFEMVNGLPSMPELLFNEKMNMPESGLYAFVTVEGKRVWSSMSALNWRDSFDFVPPAVGEDRFYPKFGSDSQYFLFSYTAEFESQTGFVPVSFYILQNRETFDKERAAFAQALWYWFGIIALVLFAMLLYSLNMALHPINQLISQIKQAEQGKIEKIEARLPPELEALKASINHLLSTERQQRVRYKNSLGDLAHSLKTPLAVLSNMSQLPAAAQEPMHQIDAIIQRQLKRAVAGSGSGWEKPQPVLPLCQKLIGAMKKVYASRQLDYIQKIDAGTTFRGDNTDLMEVLGNLLDNACKAARTTVQISATCVRDELIIRVEDDGQGIAAPQREQLLERGTRLDTYVEGHGIGMAVVADLVAAYKGSLEISDSRLGGACITVIFRS